MRGLSVLLAAGALVALPVSASADPKILSVGLEQSSLTGSGLTIAVRASDPDQGMTSMTVILPNGGGIFGESACRLDRKGREKPTPGLGAGRRSRFAFPWTPIQTGVQELDVTVTSGACGLAPRRAHRSVKVNVGIADLPPLPAAKPPKATPAQTGCPATNLVPARGNLGKIRASILCLLNVQRGARGLPQLRASSALRRAARRHSADMLRRGYFDHQLAGGPTLVDRLRRVGYWPATVGENLGMGAGTLGTPVNMVLAWLDSDHHRENILERRFRELGVGVVVRGGQVAYTTDFGSR